jgi:hypothetical protein
VLRMAREPRTQNLRNQSVGLQELRHLEATLQVVSEADWQRLEATMNQVAVERRGANTGI